MLLYNFIKNHHANKQKWLEEEEHPPFSSALLYFLVYLQHEAHLSFLPNAGIVANLLCCQRLLKVEFY